MNIVKAVKKDFLGRLRFFLIGVIETAHQATAMARSLWSLFEQHRRNIQEQGELAGTALRVQVHDLLQQKPIISIPAACKALALTHPAVGKSLRRLHEMGIVRDMTGRQRNRVYVYDAYLRTLSDGMEIPA